MCHIASAIRLAASICTLGLLIGVGLPAHADLLGSSVTGHIEVPDRGDVASNKVSAVVGQQIEFPDGTFYSTSAPYFAVPVTIDLQANYVLATIDATEFTAPGSFNGYVFDFSNLSTPILNAYLDPSSNFTPEQGRVGFSAYQLTYSDPSLLVPKDAIIKIDVEFAPTPVSPVPEPSGLFLMAAGCTGLGLIFRKIRERVGV